MSATPPVAPRRPVTRIHHGIERTDDYDWLREKDSPEVIALLEQENAYAKAATEHLAPLREEIVAGIKARTLETNLSVPTRLREHWYYSRTFEGKQYGASCRIPVRSADDWTPPLPDTHCAVDQPALPGEELLLDFNELAQGHEFFSTGGISISIDGHLCAYSIDVVGDERYTLRIKDLRTGTLLPDELTGVLGGGVWAPDGNSLYYVTMDESWRANKVWQHRLGTAQSEDTLTYEETDERFWVGIGRSRSSRFMMISSGSKITSEVHVLDTESDDSDFVVFAPRQEGVEYGLDHAVIGGVDRFLVLHNATGPDFEIGLAEVGRTVPAQDWSPLIQHRAGVRLEDVDAFSNHLVVHQRSEGLTQLRILELDPSGERGVVDDYLVDFEDEVRSIAAGSNTAFEQPAITLGYTTMKHPSSVYQYHLQERTLTLLKQSEVLGGYDPEEYVERRLWAPSTNGAKVPISLIHRRGATESGPIPFLLYGYGSYEHSVDPYFSIARLALLDRGAGFAIAHIRGGGEMGRHWYDDGKLAVKQHTFDDFIACARTLIAEGLAEPETLLCEGGSAGGLLIGAVLNQAPELWGGAVAEVPFVDPLTSMLDSSLPLTVGEYDEWGNPEADPAAYATIAAYSPYDNVAAIDYPPILALTSLHDTRVLYVEPAKWIAKLRATATGRRDFVLKTELAAGHGGVSGRYQAWAERAFTLAWMLERMGLSDRPPVGPS